jgi:archaeal flagellar protein FlaI
MMPRIIVETSSPRQQNEVPRGVRHLLNRDRMKRPRFSQCWILPSQANGAMAVDAYAVSDSQVQILSKGTQTFYHVSPWEYNVPKEWSLAVQETIDSVSNCPPADVSRSYEELRRYVRETAGRSIRRIAQRDRLELGSDEKERTSVIEKLANVTARYTIGLGLFEVLLGDDRIEDIYVDAPSRDNPIHVTVGGIKGSGTVVRCQTNIVASSNEIEGLVSRFRQYSRRPFSEAFPVLETDVVGFDARATFIGRPLSPNGTALALRRHSRSVWTLPRFMFNGTIDAMTAGLISFLIDGRSTILFCGPRGSGKSSLLSASLFEFPMSQRILTIEDTMELPCRQMQRLGFRVQSMLVENRMGQDQEDRTDQALRVSLRLGESAIVLGEVRGKEAMTLYESMRTGKAGSSVLGTIHGDSARSVFERVVHDLGISGEAFSATDMVITLGLNRIAGGQRQERKVVEVAECAKSRGVGEFDRLVVYDNSTGTPHFDRSFRSECISRIASSWNISYEEAMLNIGTRAKMRQVLVDAATAGRMDCLGPEWTCKCNEFFWGRVESAERDYDAMVRDFSLLVSRGM